ncbi:DsrE family protein [Gluconacetobacter sacchari]|uniref:DsrE family protein n=1 Tax=Gluconacetobacter sacchari TaxID=92759 RepID=A0A7W4NM51_9PROT|nr:DsrE family protein [Gluconacetobacter sacchari]
MPSSCTKADSLKNVTRLIFASLSLLGGGGGLTKAQAGDTAVPAYGAIHAAGNVANHPDPSLRYRVVFETMRAAPDPAQINPSLERAARFMNLLAADGIHPAIGDVVAMVYGPATPSVLSDAAYRVRFGRDNPNTGLLRALRKAGVTIEVCSYALAGQKIERDAVADGVQIDLSAMVTLANLQLRGWAVIH